MVWSHLVVQVFGGLDHGLFFLLFFSSNHLLFPKMTRGLSFGYTSKYFGTLN